MKHRQSPMHKWLVRGTFALCTLFLAMLMPDESRAQANILGSCANYDFNAPGASGSIDRDGYIVRNAPVPVIRENAQLRAAPGSTSKVIGSLSFAQRVGIHRRVGTAIEVKSDPRDAQTIGWVDGNDILCRPEPLVSATTGLEQKFYIKTRASFQGDTIEPVRALPAVDMETCDESNVRCRDLSRFSLYYVHAIDFDRRRLLLLGEYRATVTAALIGWVDADDGYLWETRFGLRPRADFVYDEETAPTPEQVGQERFVCVYKTIEEAKAQGPCELPVLGGERWFSYPIRIPVIDRVEGSQGVYNVILPVAGLGEDVGSDIFEQAEGLEAALRSLQQLRKLDVFFLIDGTQSMEPHIDAIVGRGNAQPGVLSAITEAFRTDARFSGTQVRFGYRVYRDLYDGQGGVGEGLPLSSTCDLNDTQLEAEHTAFHEGIKSITTNVPLVDGKRDPDHEENLFFGLYQAVDDMSTCSEHVKLLFVIGDTGYSAESQVAQGGVGITVQDVIDFITLNTSEGIDPIIPFFVQVPEARRSEAYRAAYEKFIPQAREIAAGVLSQITGADKDLEKQDSDDLVISLSGRRITDAQTDLVNHVLTKVSGFGDQTPINEIIAELKGGEALVNIITQLQQAGEYGNLPGLRLSQIERRLCDELGPACRERVYNTIAEGYVLDDDAVITDVWMSYDEFSQWRSMLEVFRNTSNTGPDRLSSLIVQQMTRTLQGGIGELTPDDVGQPIAAFLERRHGLPVGQLTPLLQYTLADLMTVRESSNGALGAISVCELNLLGNWLERHREIFDGVFSGDIPEFELVDQEVCPNPRHPTPLVQLTGYRRFAKPGMDFKHVLGDRTIFWVPSEYLP